MFDEDENTPPSDLPIVDPPTQPLTPAPMSAAVLVPEPKTGPLEFLGHWFAGRGKGNTSEALPTAVQAMPPPTLLPVRERSAIEKMRDTVAEFDEDYKGIGERVLGFFMQLGWLCWTVRSGRVHRFGPGQVLHTRARPHSSVWPGLHD